MAGARAEVDAVGADWWQHRSIAGHEGISAQDFAFQVQVWHTYDIAATDWWGGLSPLAKMSRGA